MQNNLKSLLAVTKALADPNRVRALLALQKGERCICQIIALLKLAPSTVSKHMSLLKQAGLVESRKEGRWVYYRQPDQKESPGADEFIGLCMKLLKNDPTILTDNHTMKVITCQDLGELCRKRQKK
jgi:DNA-binding transcriptional ArsR family regulator